MIRCNDCKSLESSINGKSESKHITNKCKRYNIELKMTAKLFKDYIMPCTKCNGNDFELKGVLL